MMTAYIHWSVSFCGCQSQTAHLICMNLQASRDVTCRMCSSLQKYFFTVTKCWMQDGITATSYLQGKSWGKTLVDTWNLCTNLQDTKRLTFFISKGCYHSLFYLASLYLREWKTVDQSAYALQTEWLWARTLLIIIILWFNVFFKKTDWTVNS